MCRPLRCLLAALLSAPLHAAVPGFDGGHLKLAATGRSYPDDSLLRAAAGSRSLERSGDLRLRVAAHREGLGVVAHYQVLGQWRDAGALHSPVPGLFDLAAKPPDDRRRWWDLTDSLDRGDAHAAVQRLDRLYAEYAGEQTVLRFGRQAVSWGNGLIYTPMDFFNPFDPAAVDTQYKPGDDMLYGQYLLEDGSDWQFVQVQRRDAQGEFSAKVSSTALKFHGFGLQREFDLLLARHFDETVLGAGGALNTGAAILRGDITVTHTREEWVASAVANWSYSWVWGAHNVSGVLEYFFNGFGLRQSDYELSELGPDSALLQRLARGELFTLGRHYLAGSLLLELNPLLSVTPNLFLNLGDGSALAQLVLRWDAGQNWELLAALSAPLGPAGTEYGGLESGIDDLSLAAGPSLFAQIAWYF
ncbi:MAG: hypothetical protein KDI01_08610 [Halioglobus sp.]|nr:hypothetical protein [Halioglobus sp.]